MKQLGGLGAMDPQETSIPTAEEFFEQGGTYPELAIEFAKLHVKAALEAQQSYFNKYTQLDEGYENAYPLENIK